jgi:hypothetical protein
VPNRSYRLAAADAGGDKGADGPALDPADQPAYGLSASGADAGHRDEPGTAKVAHPDEPVARRPAIPAGAPIAGAIWTESGPEVFALHDGRIWRTFSGGPAGDWADHWTELPYTGNRKPFVAVAAHSEPEKGERNAVLGVIGTTPHVNDAKGLWGAMTRPGAGVLHDMRLADVAIATPQGGPGGKAFAVEAQGQVWERSGGNWFSPDPWKEIPAGRAPVSAIAACSDGDSVPALFAVAGGKVYSRKRRGLYYGHPWEDVPPPAVPIVDVACWSLGTRHFHVFALDADGRIWISESSDDMRTWANWQLVNPLPGEARVITATSRHATSRYSSQGEGTLIAVTADGLIYEGRHDAGVIHHDWPTWSRLPPL